MVCLGSHCSLRQTLVSRLPVLRCFSFTLFNVEEFRGKKRRRKERKRDRVRASYLWTSDVSATALAQPFSLLHALWSHEVKKEDWPFLPQIHAQGFALFINFLSTCVQTVGAPFVHYFYCNWTNLFKILLSQIITIFAASLTDFWNWTERVFSNHWRYHSITQHELCQVLTVVQTLL